MYNSVQCTTYVNIAQILSWTHLCIVSTYLLLLSVFLCLAQSWSTLPIQDGSGCNVHLSSWFNQYVLLNILSACNIHLSSWFNKFVLFILLFFFLSIYLLLNCTYHQAVLFILYFSYSAIFFVSIKGVSQVIKFSLFSLQFNLCIHCSSCYFTTSSFSSLSTSLVHLIKSIIHHAHQLYILSMK